MNFFIRFFWEIPRCFHVYCTMFHVPMAHMFLLGIFLFQVHRIWIPNILELLSLGSLILHRIFWSVDQYTLPFKTTSFSMQIIHHSCFGTVCPESIFQSLSKNSFKQPPFFQPLHVKNFCIHVIIYFCYQIYLCLTDGCDS